MQGAAAEPGRRPAQQQFVGVDLRRPKGYAAPAASKVAAAGASAGEGDPCPRCESRDTKFCYYNNYNTSQPRHFCKGCRRYWTKGGTLRNVPVGGGTRKKSSSSSAAAAAEASPPSSYDAAAARPDKPKKPSKKKRRVVGSEPLALAAAKATATATTTTAEIAAGAAATPTTADAASEITTELVVPAATTAAAEEDSLAHLFQPDDVALGLGLSDDFPAGKGLVDVVEPDSFEWPAAFDLGGACWGGGGLADPDPACLFLNLP